MDDTKTCPYCGESIQKSAIKCKWCGEWLKENTSTSSASLISCPTCGEQIPHDSKKCPLCNEPLPDKKHKEDKKTPNHKLNPKYILIGIGVVIVLLIAGFIINKHSNEKDYQEELASNPYAILTANLEKAVASGEGLNTFVRDPKNVEPLKAQFGDDTYSLVLALSSYSDEPLTSCDPNDNTAGGYAWRSAGDKGKYGCRLVNGYERFGWEFFYDGMKVNEFGRIVRNDNWKCEYYKNDFNEDDESRPYIRQSFEMEGPYDKAGSILIDINNVVFGCWGPYYDQIILRNNDTGEVWDLPIGMYSTYDKFLLPEGIEKFTYWFNTAKSITMSYVDSTGQYTPATVTLDAEKMRFYETFMSHVMKKRVESDIFCKIP